MKTLLPTFTLHKVPFLRTHYGLMPSTVKANNTVDHFQYYLSGTSVVFPKTTTTTKNHNRCHEFHLLLKTAHHVLGSIMNVLQIFHYEKILISFWKLKQIVLIKDNNSV